MSADPPIPIDPDFRIQLPNFEGPLDLLLYLIQKHELDVIDLPVAFVTEKYVEYLGLMQRLNLDVAAEYLLMAATLAHIKSKSLLPPDPSRDAAEEQQEEEQDPRAELIRRLLEYQKYKKVAEELGARGVAGRDVFTRGSNAVGPLGPPPLAELSVFKLLDAFRKIAESVKGEMRLEVSAERISIQERITQIVEVLRVRKKMPFEQLFEGATTTYELVVSFLALLEMAKMRMLRIYQADPDSPIHLEGRLLDAYDDGSLYEAPLGEAFESTSESATAGDAAPASETSQEVADDVREPGESARLPSDEAYELEEPEEGAREDSDDAGGFGDDVRAFADDVRAFARELTEADDEERQSAGDAPEGFWPEPAVPSPAPDLGAPEVGYVVGSAEADPDRAAAALEPRAAPPATASENEIDPDAHLWPVGAGPEMDARPWTESEPPRGGAPDESGDAGSFWPLGAEAHDAEDDAGALGAGLFGAHEPQAPAPEAPDRAARPLPDHPDATSPITTNERDPEASFWPLEAAAGETGTSTVPFGGTDSGLEPPPPTGALDSDGETRQDPDLGARGEPEDSR